MQTPVQPTDRGSALSRNIAPEALSTPLPSPLPNWILWRALAASLALLGCGSSDGSDPGAAGQDAATTKTDTETDTETGDEVWVAPDRPPCTTDGECADSDECTWDERCEDDGFCAVRFITCDDLSECTDDYCDPGSGCVFAPREGPCDDGDPCTLDDVCNGGLCFSTTIFPCDDGNPCTDDVCDPDTGDCRFTPGDGDFGDCDDGDACTILETCVDGLCTGQPVDCPDDSACRVYGCDPDEGCVFAPLEGGCTDGNVCTTGDTCQDGTCVGGAGITCDDGNPCTDDACHPLHGCVASNNLAPCDDGIACTADDTCQDGQCVSGPDDCNDQNVCTLDFCTPTGQCTHVPVVAPCDDGNSCTQEDFCVAGVCQGVTAGVCSDGDICTTDTCVESEFGGASCSNVAVTDCLDKESPGNYFGPLNIGWNVAGEVSESTCFGSALGSVSGPGGVVSFSAACEWDDALSTANKSVLVTFHGTLGDSPQPFDSPYGVVSAYLAEGALILDGAMDGELDAVVAVSVDLGQPTLLGFASGMAVSPPANLATPVSLSVSLAASEEPVGVCCTPDGDCFPAAADVCEDVGADPPAEPLGECCIETPDGEQCTVTPPGWCAQTAQATYYGPTTSACCHLGGCAEVTAAACAALGGLSKPGLDCADQNGDGFADGCPAPEGCGLPDDVVSCTLVELGAEDALDALVIDIAGGVPLTLRGTWSDIGDGSYQTSGEQIVIELPGDVEIPVPIVGVKLTATCAPFFALEGDVALPNLDGVDGLDVAELGITAPSVQLGYALGQDLGFLDAPLADCAPYLYFYGTTSFTFDPGGGLPGTEANPGSELVLALDIFDPALFIGLSGEVLTEATANVVDDLGFGLSKTGQLVWSSTVAVPPAPGKPPAGFALTGHVYTRGKLGFIPIPKSPVQVKLDGEVVVDLGDLPSAGESLLVALFGGDSADMQAALDQVGDGASVAELLSTIRYGVNAENVTLEVDDFVASLGTGTFIYEGETLRFAAQTPETLGELFPEAPSALTGALDKLNVTAIGGATGFIDGDALQIRVTADMTVGPVELNGSQFTVTWADGAFEVDVDLPALSVDFEGWFDELKTLFSCDDLEGDDCSVAGFPVTDFELAGEGGKLTIKAMVELPFGLGGTWFEAEVDQDGGFTLSAILDVPMGPFDAKKATLRIMDNGIRFIGSIEQMTQNVTFDGMITSDGTVDLTGSGSWSPMPFVQMGITAHFDNVGGTWTMSVEGDYTTPFGGVELSGTVAVGSGGQPLFDLTGETAFDVFSIAQMDGTVRVTNQDGTGVFMSLDVDIPLLKANLDGEVFDDGTFALVGTGTLDIPGFDGLGQADVSVDPKGLRIGASMTVAGTGFAFSGAITKSGFRFTGYNDVSLLGFKLKGAVTFEGGTGGAEFTFKGKLAIGANTIAVAGLVNPNGTFSFTGSSEVTLFGYRLTSASVTFDDTGVALSGNLGVLGNDLTFSGRIEADLDFALSVEGGANIPLVGGLDGSFTITLQRTGATVRLEGLGEVSFFGAEVDGSFKLSSKGDFEFKGDLTIDWSAGPLSTDGTLSLTVRNAGFTALVAVRACAEYLLDSACGNVGASVNSSGKVCLEFPIAGNKCVEVF